MFLLLFFLFLFVHADYLLLPEGTPWVRKEAVANSALSSALVLNSEPLPFFPGCFSDDTITHEVIINIDLDYSLRDVTKTDIVLLFGNVRLLYLKQLNIKLSLGEVTYGKATDPPPLGSACVGAMLALSEYVVYIGQKQSTANYNMLLSRCFSGVTGVAYLGSLNAKNGLNAAVSQFSWLTFAHELGHAFGSTHSFENGIGTTGGIMDYGDGKYNDVYQFHPFKAPEICGFLDYVKLPVAIAESQCGDGLLHPDEECECLSSAPSCKGCRGCRLTNRRQQCSSRVFQMGYGDGIEIVSPVNLAHARCCNADGRLAKPKTGCDSGGACVARGKCLPLCSLYGFGRCKFLGDGCQMGCISSTGACRFDIRSQGNYISNLPQNSTCTKKGGKCNGKGVCITNNVS